MYLDIDRVLRAVAEGSDGIDRIKRVGAALDEVDLLTAELGSVRRAEIERLLSTGMGQNEIGRQVGLTGARISQLLKAGPGPERMFFGPKAQPVIAAVAQKKEGDKAKPGPVVSTDDMYAYEKLRELVESYGLKTSYEIIKPPGMVRLNRDGLVLICGPRHSALIEQILEADEFLGFEKDDEGWYLVDRETGNTYRSPEDSDEPGDIAYFGRLPRPDGKGTFLYMAGIHSSGSAGVVHYLANELPSLWREVRTKRFSMLIECRYDPETREVLTAKPVTPIYKPEVGR